MGKFFLENWESILSIVFGIVSIAIMIVGWIKSGNKSGLLKLYAQIPRLVIEAEQLYGAGHGVAKLNYVVTELRVYAMENKVKITKDELIDLVNNEVAMTKQVNVTPSKEDPSNQLATDDITVCEVGADNRQIDVNV